eukprot:PITA_09069
MAILRSIDFHHERDSGCTFMILMVLYITVVHVLVTTIHGEMYKAQGYLCNYGAQYTSGSKFESNLKTVFNNLVQRTPQTGFNTIVNGQSPDRVSGLLQCRGDTTVDQCSNCAKFVTSSIKNFCGNGVGARVWFDFCYLRYENYSFIGQMGDDGIYINLTGNAMNPSVSIPIVGMLWSKLSDEAASAMKRCAFDRTVDSLSRNIYGQAQCTRDISTNDCRTCLSNTINNSLSTYSGSQSLQGLMSSCIVSYETYSFFNLTALPVAPAEAPAHTPPNKYNSPHINQSRKIPITLGVVGGFLLILFVCLFATWKRLKSAIFGRPCEGQGQVKEDALIIQDQQIVMFKRKTLLAATENFHDNNKLGEGGFGPVYKGITEDGKEIAVKKLSLTSRQGRKEFLNEVKLVAKIRHRNVVNILGCCAEGSERLLVYEYLPNKSLDKILLDPNKPLDWPKRYNIILGVARGLLYLHQDSHLRVIHRDIKATNILLDENLNPKIADFGLARLFPENVTHVSTGAVAGTYGYMAPEYALHGQLSAWTSYQQGNIVQMVDPALIETCDREQAFRCLHVGLLCTQADPSLRPLMPKITMMLSPQFVGLPDPTKPPLVISVNQNINSTNSVAELCSRPSSI